MKKVCIVFLIFVLCISLCGCASIQASLADAMEDAYGVEGKTYEEHKKNYQAEWDSLFHSFNILKNYFSKNKAKEDKAEVETPEEEPQSVPDSTEALIENKLYDLKDEYGDVYTGEEQCKGFAKKVFKDLFGDDVALPSTNKATGMNYELVDKPNDDVEKVDSLINMSSLSDEEVKNAFANARPGDVVQMRRGRGGSHTAVVVSVTDTGPVWLEANVDDNNGIQMKPYTWQELREQNAAMTIYTAADYTLDQ